MADKTSFLIQDVPIEITLHVSKMVNASITPLTTDSVIKGMQGIAKQSYVRRGLAMALQLGMIESVKSGEFKGVEKFKENFRKITISDFPIIARKALQDYVPFLFYLENIMMGYSSVQASTITAGVFDLDEKNCMGFFKKSGIYSQILSEKDGNISIASTISTSPDYVENLKNMLNSDLEAKNLISSLLSSQVVAYFAKKGVNFNRPAEALVEIKKDPKTSLYKIFEFAETCLYQLGDDLGASVQTANGLGELVNAIRSQKGILKNPTNLGVGLGSLRNMTNHGPDKDTGKTWDITEEASLGASLLVLRYIRSVYLQSKQKIQEI